MEITKVLIVIGISTGLVDCQVTEHVLRTYQSPPRYIKGINGQRATCSQGKSDAIKFHILDPGLTAKLGQTSFRVAGTKYYLKTDYQSINIGLENYKGSIKFNRAGSFETKKNYRIRDTTSYQSIEYPGYFLACKQGNLVLTGTSAIDSKSYSFVAEKVDKIEEYGWTQCTETCGGGIQWETTRSCIIPSWCANVRSRRCNTQPCDPCTPNPCRNGGSCRKTRSSYKCSCPSGFFGKHCETEQNPCKPNPCENGGTCLRRGAEYTCRCRPEFQGLHCEEEINPCRPNPCRNGGTCERRGTDYSCRCRSDFTGVNCEKEVSPCSPNPCENGGTCVPRRREYICRCPAGFTGLRCERGERNPCIPNPCQNNGQCSHTGSEYSCQCPSGVTGANCEHRIMDDDNPCKPNPCKNGGTCTRTGSEYRCECRTGFSGFQCEKGGSRGGGCQPNPCENGGECITTIRGYVCNCKMPYHGHNCVDKLNMDEWSQCSRSCGGGTRYKAARCADGQVENCPREYEDCSTGHCPDVSCPKNMNKRFGNGADCCHKESGSCGVTKKTGRRIFGGVMSDRAQWPWTAAIIYKPLDTFFCGAALIDKQWVVTAAHCAEQAFAHELQILIGANNRNKPEAGSKKVDVTRIIIHPDYKNPESDIALMKLKEPLATTFAISPICLPEGEETSVETECFAAGWGIARDENIAERITEIDLRHVGLRCLPRDACVQGFARTIFSNNINEKIICAGLLKGGKDTCTGDSGGPLVCQRKDSCNWYLAGITSFGPDQCGLGSIPGAYVNVVLFEKWIKIEIASN